MKRYILLLLAALLLAGCAAQTVETTPPATTLPAETTIPIPEVTVCTEPHEPWTPVQNYFEAYRTGVGTDFQNYAPAEYWRMRIMRGKPDNWGVSGAYPASVEQWRERFEKNTAAMIGGPKAIYGEDYTVTLTLREVREYSKELREDTLLALEAIGIARDRVGEMTIWGIDVRYEGSNGSETTRDFYGLINIDGRWYWGGLTYDGDIVFQFPH